MRFPALWAWLLLAIALATCCARTPRRLAIMDFENNTGDPNYEFLRRAVPEHLNSHLANNPRVDVLERQDIHPYLAHVDGLPPGLYRDSHWQWLGRKIGAEFLIAGSIARLDHHLVLTSRIFDVERGQVLSETGLFEAFLHEYEIYYRTASLSQKIARRLPSPAMALSGASRRAPPPGPPLEIGGPQEQ